MSLQRQFEGPDVRALLDEIRATYGADPTISRAETFRTGGVLGFFQREHFRLVVEGQPVPATGGASAPAAGPATEDLTGGVPGAPQQLALAAYAAIAGRKDPAPLSGVLSDQISLRLAGSAAAPMGGLQSLIASGSATTYVPSTSFGSTPSDPFALLADETEDSFESMPVGTGSVPARSFHPASLQTASAGVGADLAGTDATIGGGRTQVVEAPSFETVLQRVADLVDRPDATPMVWPEAAAPTSTTGWSQTTEAPPTPEPPQAIGASIAPEPPQAASADAAPAAPDTEDHDGQPTFVAAPPVEAEPLTEAMTEDRADLRLALYRAGFNPSMAAEIEGAVAEEGLEAALLQLFDELPEAPRLPRRNGSLVVVVGPGRRAAAEATRIASEVGADPAGVAFACERRPVWPTTEELVIHSAEDAMELAPGHRRGRIGVVAVDTPVGASSTVWARHIIHALRPTLVVGVVDAMYKNEDIDSWVRALDGVDALVVDNTDVTTSPARVLDLEVPVSRLGEQPASAARWTATILDCVEAESEVEG